MTQTAAKGEATTIEPTRAGQVLARRLAESRATIPVFELGTIADLHDADRAVDPVDHVIRAAALALREHPLANASYRDARIEQYARINIGVAIATGGTLLTPVIQDANTLEAREIAALRREQAALAQAGTLTSPHMSGATFTVQALDVSRFGAVVVPGQSAALAVGALEARAVAHEGAVALRDTVQLTLSCDSRVLFADDAAAFLRAVRENLQR